MGDKSAIEWTDASWNPVTGCSKVSPGCAHCYAETVALRFWPTQYLPVEELKDREGDGYPRQITVERPRAFTDVQCHEDRLDQPPRWRKPRRIFVNSVSDLFHESVPDAFLDKVFAVMALSPQHTFQVLTKRAERARAYLTDETLTSRDGTLCAGVGERIAKAMYDIDKNAGDVAWPLSNVWLGPSIENQAMADRRFPIACELGEAGWNVMVSMEPLLSAVTIPDRFLRLGRRAWVIPGGESGAGARPCAIEWIESIIAQCADAGVPVFVKQLGARPLFHDGGGRTSEGLRDKKGGDPSEWPADLRVREFPKVRA